ncbi:MAG: phosphoadenylyl-sulfate reductase [Flavobacteriales bacterium Tduv]
MISNNFLKEQLLDLRKRIENFSFQNSLEFFTQSFPNRVVFSTSFSMEDQVISHIILNEKIPIDIFTLDTGRLFAKTYQVWSMTDKRYKTHISAYYPKHDRIERFVSENGPDAFYESVEKRQQCCHIRKVEPLKRALKDKKVWITGLRSEHSPDRKRLEPLEWDDVHQLLKYHPLLPWTSKEVNEFIQKFYIPYNPLHDQGFVSIGCAPCTRAINPGESFRSGRWWWEDETKKECGLHLRTQHIYEK